MWKSGLRTVGHHAIFWVLQIKRSKMLQKHTRLFLFTFLVSSFMVLLAQKLIYTINIWFNFAPGLFLEQDHPLNLIILGVYFKRLPKCARILKHVAQICLINFFLTLTVRRSFYRKDFKWTKIWGMGLLSEKKEALHAELNERAEAATSSFLQWSIFYNIFVRCLWLRIIRRSDQSV